jgi:hypothetical protein
MLLIFNGKSEGKSATELQVAIEKIIECEHDDKINHKNTALF